MTIDDCPIARDQDRLSERRVPKRGDGSQLGGRRRKVVPVITWVRLEFVRATSYQLALNLIQLSLGLAP